MKKYPYNKIKKDEWGPIDIDIKYGSELKSKLHCNITKSEFIKGWKKRNLEPIKPPKDRWVIGVTIVCLVVWCLFAFVIGAYWWIVR